MPSPERLAELRTEALRIVRETVAKREDPALDSATEISRAHNLIGLLHQQLNRIPR